MTIVEKNLLVAHTIVFVKLYIDVNDEKIFLRTILEYSEDQS